MMLIFLMKDSTYWSSWGFDSVGGGCGFVKVTNNSTTGSRFRSSFHSGSLCIFVGWECSLFVGVWWWLLLLLLLLLLCTSVVVVVVEKIIRSIDIVVVRVSCSGLIGELHSRL